MTDEQLRAIMPGAPATKRAGLLPFLQAALTEFAIETPAREAAFIAQLAHESGQFRFMEEIWGPTDAQRRYEPQSTLATRLGNTEPGDGRRFKGRGPIQITGRANYRRFGDLLGIDLVSTPATAALPEQAFRIAGLFWVKKGLNELADQASAEAFREITKRINGGLNGLKDREAFYAVARTVLGVTDAPSARGTGNVRSMPRASDDPPFERGDEAVREFARRRRGRTAASKSKKTGARRAKTSHRATRRRPVARRPALRAGSKSKAPAASKRRKRATAKGRSRKI